MAAVACVPERQRGTRRASARPRSRPQPGSTAKRLAAQPSLPTVVDTGDAILQQLHTVHHFCSAPRPSRAEAHVAPHHAPHTAARRVRAGATIVSLSYAACHQQGSEVPTRNDDLHQRLPCSSGTAWCPASSRRITRVLYCTVDWRRSPPAHAGSSGRPPRARTAATRRTPRASRGRARRGRNIALRKEREEKKKRLPPPPLSPPPRAQRPGRRRRWRRRGTRQAPRQPLRARRWHRVRAAARRLFSFLVTGAERRLRRPAYSPAASAGGARRAHAAAGRAVARNAST